MLLGSAIVLACGCAHHGDLHSTREREMTLGVVQKEIRVGMSQVDVAAALGSPNIVSRDREGREAWIYDKVATEVSYSDSSGNVSGSATGGGLAGDTLLIGMIGGGYGRKKGGAATTQKTLTVIIRFDADAKVESFSYHSSKF
ncbi:MAG TPA: hypothetical protein HPP83_01520 [Candidatus Hydrogenedentes bacterium]|nr:hypothetical protein [Candidatus Hydrogenedentota bacterium]